jgi:Zn ribbon nucleic-acid-binding protein
MGAIRRKDIYEVPEPRPVTLYVKCLGLNAETFIPYIECVVCEYAVRHNEKLQCSHPEAREEK